MRMCDSTAKNMPTSSAETIGRCNEFMLTQACPVTQAETTVYGFFFFNKEVPTEAEAAGLGVYGILL